MTVNNAVNKTVLERLLGSHEVVSFGILFDRFDRFARALGKYTVQCVTRAQKQIRTDLDVAAP